MAVVYKLKHYKVKNAFCGVCGLMVSKIAVKNHFHCRKCKEEL